MTHALQSNDPEGLPPQAQKPPIRLASLIGGFFMYHSHLLC
jgi:hypothetical protein